MSEFILVEITDGNFNTLAKLRSGGLKGIAREREVVIHPINERPNVPRTCKANFTYFIDPFDPLKRKVFFGNHSTGGESYIWTFGDGNISTEEEPEYTYSSSGIYTVCLEVYANQPACYDKICKTIEVGNLCTADFSYSADNKGNLTFINWSQGPHTTYRWDFGEGGVSTDFQPTYKYTNSGTYNVCLTVSGGNDCLPTKICQNITVTIENNCCDKNDREHENWTVYASGRKFKSVIWQTNIFGINNLGAKTKNFKQKRNDRWVKAKADIIEACVYGKIYFENSEGENCALEVAIPLNCKTEYDKKKAKIRDAFNQTFWTKKESIHSHHGVRYNGSDYTNSLSLSRDCH